MARTIHAVNLLLALALVGFATWAWGQLPDRVPSHLDVTGRPTGWGERSVWTWYLLTAIGLATAGLIYALASWSARRPDLLNLPGKERLLALPPERRDPVLGRIRQLVQGLAAPVLLVFVVVQAAIYRAALGHDVSGLVVTVLVLALALPPVLIAVGLPLVLREIERQARAA